jgi:hypothetical protein
VFSNRKQTLIGAGVVIACGFGFYFWQSSRLKTLSVERQRIGVLRLDNQTGDAELDAAGTGLAALVAERLGGLPGVAAFVTASPAEAAGRGATLVLHGRIEQTKGQYRVVANLERLASREFEAAGSVAGEKKALPALMDAIASGVQSAVRPKGQLAAAEFRTLEAAVALGRSMESGDAGSAIAELDAAVRVEPGCGLCWRRLVELDAAAGRRDEALARVEASRAGKVSPMSRAAIDYEAARLRNDVPGQRSALERLAKLRAGEPEYLERLSRVLSGLGQWNEAAETLRSAVQAAPLEPDLWNEFGYALAWAGKTEEAMRALNEYARLAPDSANPGDSRGEVALMAGRFAQAIEFFEESYKKDKTFNGGQALEKAAMASYLNGEKARAASYVDRYLGALPQPPGPAARLMGARWQYALGGIDAALKTAEKADAIAAAVMAAAAGDEAGAARLLAAAPQQNAGGGRLLLAASTAWPPELASRAELAPLRAFRAVLERRWSAATAEFRAALKREQANSPQASLLKECAAWTLAMDSKAAEAGKLLGGSWPMPPPAAFSEIALLVYPNLFYTRAEIALAAGKVNDARKYYDLFLLYAGDRKDTNGMIARARAAARL